MDGRSDNNEVAERTVIARMRAIIDRFSPPASSYAAILHNQYGNYYDEMLDLAGVVRAMRSDYEAGCIHPVQEAVSEKTLPVVRKETAMDVLISWSKKQSRELASVFHSWLPKVVPGLRPWMSSKDIDKGKLWFGELQGFLSEATSCVICVTSENVRSPWIYYETGAIAAKKQDVLVCPYLVGIGTSMIADGPLAQYQCTEATKEDTLALIRSLNKALANPHDERLLVGNFESKWAEFEQELKRVLGMDEVTPADFVETDADVLAGYKLSAEARELLVTAAASKDGYVSYVRYSEGADICAGEELVNDPNSQRSIAQWERAINDLLVNDLLIRRGTTGEAFQLTAKGYEVADALQERGLA